MEGKRRPQKRVAKRVWPKRLLISCAATAAIVVGILIWDRWFHYNDANDFQGEWKLKVANKTTVIDASSMKLTGSVSYSYALDPWKKTVTFTFGDLCGSGNYYFLPDRQTLVITEGGCASLAAQYGFEEDPAVTNDTLNDKTTVLVKISDNTQATPQSLANNSTHSANTTGAAIVSGQTTAVDVD